jgi:hypothetical protein
MRRRLPWLVVLPLMVAGSVGTHALSLLFVGVHAASDVGAEGGMRDVVDRSGTGFAAHSVLALGIVAALAGAAGAGRLSAYLRGRPRRGASPWLFCTLPPLAFSLQELIERLLHAEAAPFQAALEPRFLIGLALQVPLGLGALLAARLLLRVVRRIADALTRKQPIAALRRMLAVRPPIACELPRIPALALGYSQRGPPAL